MGTPANISVLHNDGTVSTIYLHYDGYESHALEMLKEHYNTLERAEALVALGDLSELAASIECPEGHSFAHPVKGHTVAYYRDRGEPWFRVASVRVNYKELEQASGYHYAFQHGEWIKL